MAVRFHERGWFRVALGGVYGLFRAPSGLI